MFYKNGKRAQVGDVVIGPTGARLVVAIVDEKTLLTVNLGKVEKTKANSHALSADHSPAALISEKDDAPARKSKTPAPESKSA